MLQSPMNCNFPVELMLVRAGEQSVGWRLIQPDILQQLVKDASLYWNDSDSDNLV